MLLQLLAGTLLGWFLSFRDSSSVARLAGHSRLSNTEKGDHFGCFKKEYGVSGLHRGDSFSWRHPNLNKYAAFVHTCIGSLGQGSQQRPHVQPRCKQEHSTNHTFNEACF